MQLAYFFWSRPAVDAAEYERRLVSFHSRFDALRPAGIGANASFRLSAAPWLPGEGRAYEDCYPVHTFGHLSLLKSFAIGNELQAVHSAIAAVTQSGAGGLYGLLHGAGDLRGATALWLTKPQGVAYAAFRESLVSFAGARAEVWQRELGLGPAPEFLVLRASTSGALADWLPRMITRTQLFPT